MVNLEQFMEKKPTTLVSYSSDVDQTSTRSAVVTSATALALWSISVTLTH